MKEKGLCKCGKLAAEGKSLCEKCLQHVKDWQQDNKDKVAKHQKEYQEKRRELLKSLSLCIYCKQDAIPGKTHCEECKEKMRRRSRAKYQSNLQVTFV